MILDTNALSAWADGDSACRPAFAEASRLIVPAIALGEYLYGIRQSRYRARYEEWLDKNLRLVEIHRASSVTADHYANLRTHLKSVGTPIPANDLWIAAMTQELNIPLLSNDAHFDLVPNLIRLSF